MAAQSATEQQQSQQDALDAAQRAAADIGFRAPQQKESRQAAPLKVQLVEQPFARKGSREEFKLIAKINNQGIQQAAKRHAETLQKADEQKASLMQIERNTSKLSQLEFAESVG